VLVGHWYSYTHSSLSDLYAYVRMRTYGHVANIHTRVYIRHITVTTVKHTHMSDISLVIHRPPSHEIVREWTA